MIRTSRIHRKLDAKFKIGGMEATDLLAVLLLAAVMNLVFGQFSFGPVLIFLVPGTLFCALYFGKRGKPDGYLMHALKYYISPGEIWAGQEEDLK